MTKSDWKKCKLGDVAQFKTGKLNSNAAVSNGKYSFFTCAPKPLKIDTYAYDQSAILLAGNNADGNFAIHYYDGKFNAYQRTYIINTKSQICNLKYLYYALSLCLKDFKLLSQGTSTKFLTAVILNNFEILLPPLNEQKKIAGILGVLDDKIELLQKQNKTLEDMAKAIFKSWFVDFDVVHAKQKGLPKADIMREYHLTDELYDLFPSGFEPSALGPIPSGWQVKTLGDISTCYDSKRIPLSNRERAERQGNYPYYGATSIMDHVDDFLFDGIYLLLGEDGSVVKPEGTPFLQYVFGKIWVNNHAHVLQGKAPVGTEFLYLFLSDVQIQPYVTGAVQAKLNQKNMNSIPVCMATEDFVRQFQGIIEIYFVKIRSNLKQIQTLTELRDTLLPRLISGKIRV